MVFINKAIIYPQLLLKYDLIYFFAWWIGMSN